MDPSVKLQSFTAGLQASEYVNLIAQATFTIVPGFTVKEHILNSTALFEIKMTNLDHMWGMFVRLCTGVMTRIRLREVVYLRIFSNISGRRFYERSMSHALSIALSAIITID